MRFNTTRMLLMSVCLLALAIWILRGRSAAPSSPQAATILGIPPDAVVRLGIVAAGYTAECERVHADWFVRRPQPSRANATAVERILRETGRLVAEESITPAQRQSRGLSLDDFGLGAAPRARLRFDDANGRRIDLSVGRELMGILYVRREPGTDVLATSTNLLEAIPASPDDLRERRLLHGDPPSVKRMEIGWAAGGFVQMAKKDGLWRMSQPVKNARLDGAAVGRLLSALFELRALRFLPGVDAQQSGLDEAQAAVRITAWAGEDRGGQKVLLGREIQDRAGEIYAKSGDEDLACAVRKDILDVLTFKPADLRDRMVFPWASGEIGALRFQDGERKLEFALGPAGWQLVEPKSLRTDDAVMEELLGVLSGLKVQNFVDMPEGNPAALGLQDGGRGIELFPVLPEAGGAADRKGSGRLVLLGKQTDDGSGVYARLGDEPQAAILPVAPLRRVLEARYASLGTLEDRGAPPGSNDVEQARSRWIDPLTYCDRVVLEFDPAAINSLTLAKTGEEQAACLDENGKWQAVGAVTGTVANATVKETLAVAARLKALRIEGRHASSPAAFGLDAPQARLSFGFSEGKGIRKTLLFGFLAGADGVYAMIQGQDIVFVLPRKAVGALLRDLVATDAREP